MGWLGITGDFINSALPSLILVIGTSDAIHIVMRFHEERRAGQSRDAAIVVAQGRVGMACLLTTVTTSIGFLSLLSANMEILKKLTLKLNFQIEKI